jgi:ribonuclease D
LASGILNVDLPKSKKMAISPWASTPLSSEQIAYAARDAWAAAALVHRLGQLDPSRFSPDVLVDLVAKQEEASRLERLPVTIAALAAQAARRKTVKQKWKALKEQVGTWTVEERGLAEVLEQEMKDLAPPQPMVFEIQQSLGLKL